MEGLNLRQAQATTIKILCAKTKQAYLKTVQLEIDQMLDPKLQINRTTNTGIDTWAMGTMMMNFHDGVNKCISQETVLEYHNVEQQMVKMSERQRERTSQVVHYT